MGTLRWCDIGLVTDPSFFGAPVLNIVCDFYSTVLHKQASKKLGQYQATLTSYLVNNIITVTITSSIEILSPVTARTEQGYLTSCNCYIVDKLGDTQAGLVKSPPKGVHFLHRFTIEDLANLWGIWLY